MSESPAAAPGELRWLVLAFVATLPLAIACWFDRHLAMDGANFFVKVLESEAFFLPASTRVATNVIQQWALVLAVQTGVKDLRVLSAVFGFGLLLPFWLGLAATCRVLPAGQKHFMALPIWAILLIHFPLDGGLVFEGHVMTILVWPVLFLLLRRERWDGIDALLLFGALGLLAFSYESAILPELAFVALSVRRVSIATESRQRRLSLIAGALALLGAGVALVGILFPRDSGNRADFADSLLEPWRWPLQWVGLLAFAGFGVAWARQWRVAMLALASLGFAFGLCWLTGFTVPSRGWVYPNRTLFLTLAPMVVLVSAWIWKSGVAMPRDGFAACAAVTFALSVALFVRLEAWREYRAQVVNIVHGRRGLVPVAETPIWRHARRTAVNLSEAGLLWDSWNLPQLL